MQKLIGVFCSLLIINNSFSQKVGIGTQTPDSTLTVAGSVHVQGTTKTNKLLVTSGAGANKILQSDADGNAVWITPSSGATHTVGETFGGGKVFWVTGDGLHGLIAETLDQGSSSRWYDTQDFISTNSTHSAAGKLFVDWRLPTRNELNLLYLQRTTVGGFVASFYWSATEDGDLSSDLRAWSKDFSVGTLSNYNKASELHVRAIRSF